MRALLLLLAGCAGTSPIRPDVSDARRWQPVNADVARSREGDRRVVTIGPVGGNHKGSNIGMTLASGVALDEGTIEVDLRGLGADNPSFVGVVDATHYEAVYFRPFRFRATTPLEHAHAVQYVAWPDHPWEALRTASPGVYEAALEPAPDPAGWFHARVEVTRTSVRVFVDGAAQPALSVQRLAHAAGGVGLWVDSQPASFANLVIRPR